MCHVGKIYIREYVLSGNRCRAKAYIRRTRGSGKPEDRIEETRAKSKVHIEETKVRIEEIKIRIEETGETEVRIKATKVRQKIVLKL
ncbi:unnamed protein product [Rhizophagus irregularis]|uniref:Uncharacterized protein n=1 Tax=Rhizophagus irregularis TaxID=588596 RepID=A0A916A090_9GLOM|nr:unnamed protein product [Rhizophagus irregularis]